MAASVLMMDLKTDAISFVVGSGGGGCLGCVLWFVFGRWRWFVCGGVPIVERVNAPLDATFPVWTLATILSIFFTVNCQRDRCA